MGVLLLLMVLLLLAVVRTASRMADVKTNLSTQLAGKTDEVYVATGKVCWVIACSISTRLLVSYCGKW